MKAYHLVGKGPYYTNCYMLTADTGTAVLIDCSADVEKVKAILENDRAQLKAILLTHGHADHRETLYETVAVFGCPVYVGAEDREQFALEGTTDYEDGRVLKIGDMMFQVFHTPGHTPGGYCIMCRDMLFSGDTLFAGSCGRTDLPGGDWQTINLSLERLAELEGDYAVYPGHGEATTLERERKMNPYMR